MRRKQGAVKWYGPGRVLTQEGKNVWIMHGGVPILTSETMVRAATSEEYLTKELIGVTKGKKRGRGLLYEDPAQHHQLGSTGQPSYLDLRKVEDDEDAAGAALPRGGLGNIAPTERGGDEDESPKRMRALIREEEKKQEDEARSIASRTYHMKCLCQQVRPTGRPTVLATAQGHPWRSKQLHRRGRCRHHLYHNHQQF